MTFLSALKRGWVYVCNRREEDVELEGRDRAPLTKALFHSELP